MTHVSNPESKDWPCGPQGVVCSGHYPNAMCCWEGDVCGGVDPTCPAGMCCYVGSDEVGARRMRKQWHAAP